MRIVKELVVEFCNVSKDPSKPVFERTDAESKCASPELDPKTLEWELATGELRFTQD